MFSELKKTRVGLVGGNGFIGSAILQAMLDQGISPRVLCGPSESHPSLPPGIDFVICELADVERLQTWVSGCEVVIDAAGPASVRRSFQMAEEYVRVHVEGTAAILRVCRMAKVNRIVYLSSAEVYGRPRSNPVAETHPLQARSPYAAAKIGAEKMIEAHVESFGLEAVILRPFSIYGPHFHPDSLLARIVSTAHTGCIRLQDLRPVRDYCYVGDLAQAVLQACCIRENKLQIINVGSGVGTSVAHFAELVSRTLGLNIPIVEDSGDSRPGQSEIFELIADITTAHEVLRWRPTTSLQEGLQRTLSAGACKV
jgi:nucleoside-diphosphate-sugar epimerase